MRQVASAFGHRGFVVAGLLFVVTMLLTTLWSLGWGPQAWLGVEQMLLIVFLTAILFGSTLHGHEIPEASRMGDVGATAALALVLVHDLPHAEVHSGTVAVVGVSAAGLIGGGFIAGYPQRGAVGIVAAAVPRLATVALLSTVLREERGGQAWIDRFGAMDSAVVAVTMLLVLMIAMLAEAPLRAILSPHAEESLREALRREFTESATLGIVPASTAVLVALAFPVLGLPALPLLLLPLVVNQVAVRSHAEMRRHSRQSVLALSRMPEVMQFVRQGHAARVAATAVDIGRELGLSGRDVEVVERAALLHDIGQVRLVSPVPGGATILSARADQTDIAAAGAAIARATGVLDAEARLIETQAVPYHDVLSGAVGVELGGRILKVANAYDDLRTADTATLPATDVDAVLERLYLGLGHEYDPQVVDALARVVAARVPFVPGRGGDGPPAATP